MRRPGADVSVMRCCRPFTMRIADQAAGLICRKPIQLEPKEEDGEVDEYWTEWIKDVDGYGTDLDAFARRVVLNSLLLGHSAVLVDFPSTEPAENLLQERQLGLRPYFLEVRADQVLGWRKEEDSPLSAGQPNPNFRICNRSRWNVRRQGRSPDTGP